MAQLGAMLTIRRVPTLLSLNQDADAPGCGAACLEQCCEAPGEGHRSALLPLHIACESKIWCAPVLL